VGLTLSLLFLISGLALAWLHPLWPALALVLFYTWVVVVAWRPWVWLFYVPACLPFLNFWPWTGWQAFDEFDLLLLGALAGGYARSVIQERAGVVRGHAGVVQGHAGVVQGHAGVAGALAAPTFAKPGGFAWLMVALVAATAISLLRGLISAGFLSGEVDASLAASQALTYESVWNVLRIAKSLVFALLFAPLLALEMQTEASRRRAQRLFGSGMLVGLTLVTLVALWERAAYPGWLEFSTRYRTTALFWEMHVGGAAIDAYLVIATPFLGWALWSTRRRAVWAALAVLAILTCYAVLTTFSRGVYLAVLIPLILLAVSAWARRRGLSVRGTAAVAAARMGGSSWRGRAGLILALLLISEVLGVVLGGTFLAERLASAQEDLDGRVEHWSRGINLLQTPLDWAFGKGLGRLPAEYAQISPETEFSGSIRLRRLAQPEAPITEVTKNNAPPGPIQAASAYQVTLMGAASNPELGGLFSLTQRVDFSRTEAYSVSLRARAETEADVRLKICEKHMIYEGRCHYRFIKIRPMPNDQWQTLTIALRGRSHSPHASSLPRYGVFSLSVINAGGALAVQKIGLAGPSGQQILQNGDFSNGLSSWFSSSQGYYLPWHIDNVYLELLIERGLVGLILVAAWVLVGLWGLANASRQGQDLARYLSASLVGAAMLGLVSSWMDVPRIAFLVFVLLIFSAQMNRNLPHEPLLQ
jgi:hypothetical protein